MWGLTFVSVAVLVVSSFAIWWQGNKEISRAEDAQTLSRWVLFYMVLFLVGLTLLVVDVAHRIQAG